MNVTGVDVPISLIRDDFANALWLDTANRIFYAKAYRNEKLIKESNQLIPEVFTANNTYKEVLFDNKFNVSCFFDAGEERVNIIEKPEADISAHFAVNLDKLFLGETYRTEENAHSDVIEVLRASRNAYSISDISLTPGINSYGDFYRENVKGYNMQPWHTFRVDMVVNFNYDCGNPYIQTISAGGFVYPFPIIF